MNDDLGEIRFYDNTGFWVVALGTCVTALCAIVGFDPGSCPSGSGHRFWAAENSTSPYHFASLAGAPAILLLVLLQHRSARLRIGAVGLCFAAALLLGFIIAASPAYPTNYLPFLHAVVAFSSAALLPTALLGLAATPPGPPSTDRKTLLIGLLVFSWLLSYWTLSSRIAFESYTSDQQCMDWEDPVARQAFQDRLEDVYF